MFYTAEGQGVTNAQTMPRVYVHRALPDFFTTMGIPILQGRTFLDSELTPTSGVVIASEQVVTRFWPGRIPLASASSSARSRRRIRGRRSSASHAK